MINIPLVLVNCIPIFLHLFEVKGGKEQEFHMLDVLDESRKQFTSKQVLLFSND